MTFEQLVQLAIDNILYTALISIIVVFIIIRLFKTARMYLGAKSYVKSALKLDKKKYNGMTLVDYTQRKRKRNTNSFNKLRQRAKNKVRNYLEHKFEEFPVICRYKYGKLTKRTNKDLIILVKNNKKTIKKISKKKSVKQCIEVINKYDCLNEMLIFLHNLPEAILEEQEYEVYVGMEEILITYTVK